MNEDQETTPASPDLGETLVRRATDPGVIRRSLATNGGGSCCVADGGRLAAQIQRRFSPAGSVDSGGPALPLRPVATPMLSASAGPPAPSSASAPTRVARATVLPMVQAPVAQASVVARSAEATGSVPVQRSVASPEAPVASEMPVRRMSEPKEEKSAAGVSEGPAVQTSVVSRSVEMGPAIVRRSPGVQRAAGAPDRPGLPLRRMSAPEEEAPGSATQGPAVQASPAPMPAVQASPAQTSTVQAATILMPAIQARSVTRAVQAAPSPSRPHPPTPSPIAPPPAGRGGATAQRMELATGGGSPSPGRGESGGRGGQGVRPMAAAATGSSPAPALPLLQRAPPEAAGQALPLARTVQPAPAESGSGAAGDVRRQVAAGETVMASPAFPAVSPPPATGASVPAAAGGSATMAAGLSVDDVVEQVMRRLSRSLTVENERLGGRRWP